MDVVQVQSTSVAFRLNGAVDAEAGGTPTANCTGSVAGIGWDRDGGSQYFAGQVAEVIWYNTNLNSAQVLQVESYLAAKYGL